MMIEAVQDRLLRRRDLQTLFGVDTSTLRRWESWGILRPLWLGPRTIRYRQSDVEAALCQAAERGGQGGEARA